MLDAERAKWQLYIRQRTRVDPVTGCWNWQLYCEAKGYGKTGAPYFGLDQRAHRLSYTAFKGPIPKGKQLRHQCHNPPCCNPEHLLVGTAQDNKDDSKRAGRMNGGQLLTSQQVAEIKNLLRCGTHSQREVGAMFGVHQTTVCNINRGKRHGSQTEGT